MKKLIIPILLIVLSIPPVSSQSEKHEISVGYGAPETHPIGNLYWVTLWESIFTYSTKKYYYASGNITYKYNYSRKFNIGTTFSYRPEKIEKWRNNTSKRQEFRRNFFALAIEGDIKYISNSKILIYSTVGTGITLRTGIKDEGGEIVKEGNSFIPNLQLTFLGIKVGRKFGIFGELGFGYKGTSIGAFGRF